LMFNNNQSNCSLDV